MSSHGSSARGVGCVVCGQPALFLCSLCPSAAGSAVATYCSTECQRTHWPTHRSTHSNGDQQSGQPKSGSTGAAGSAIGIGRNHHQHHASATVGPVTAPAKYRNNNPNHRVSDQSSLGPQDHMGLHAPSPADSSAPINHSHPSATADANATQSSRRFLSSITATRFRWRPVALTELDADTVDDLKYYLSQIYKILKPVIFCVALAILWVKLLNPPSQYFNGLVNTPAPDIYALNYGGVSSTIGTPGAVSNPTYETSAQQTTDLYMALKTLGSVVGATVVIFLLFYFNCMKILYAIFGLIILGVLGVFGYFLSVTFLWINYLPLDYISFAFFIWNFAATGIVAIFWAKGPLWLQQAYLVLVSSMMAFMLTNPSIPPITSWILLALLAVWDLIAVLCPYGPLRLLIETSKSQNREIPALLYSAGPTTMMAAPDPAAKRQHTLSGKAIEDAGEDVQMEVFGDGQRGRVADVNQDVDAVGLAERARGDEAGEDEERSADEDGGGMKLGLGDFVFYSVLASRAALSDWVPTMAVTVGLLTGLNFTIFLLVLWQKALPALPFSIAFGLLFYFSAGLVLVPMINNSVRLPVFPAYDGGATGWLTVGQYGGGGMVYL
ncbi:Presenilin-domain-containing protein [Chytriomyces sp. MP71]|nr:Presenilin-domain-containing protein [Chytriomyces sp. MP71]